MRSIRHSLQGRSSDADRTIRTYRPPSRAAVAEIAASKPTKTRWLVLFLISLMYLICYMDRSNISVAEPEIAKQFGLSKSAMGLVLAAFTWAYALGQVPAGWLGDRFGPKRVLTVIMTLWSATAVMTGAAFGFGSLFGARFSLGLSEAGAFPVASRGMQLWFPRVERGRIQGTTHFFSRFAVAVTPFIAGSILLAFGWRAIFYIFGSLGILWAIGFSIFYRNLPEEHKGVNRAELARIRGVNPDGTHQRRPPYAAGHALEADSALAQHVVHLARLLLLLLRDEFLSDLVSDLFARTSPHVHSLAGNLGLRFRCLRAWRETLSAARSPT